MEILEAYCVELGRVVDIYEAQEEYFALPGPMKRRFEFRCSDLNCRLAHNPLVVGANYHKDAEASEKYRQPYFKSHEKHPHSDQCVWVLTDDRKRTEGSDGERRGEDRAKATNLIDVFEPRRTDSPLRSVSAMSSSAASDSEASDPSAEVRGPTERSGISTTSRLEKLVDCWAQIDSEERKSCSVLVAGQALTYQQLCIHVKYLRANESGLRIVYGGARASAWPKEEPTHYFINFIDDLEKFGAEGANRSLTVSLPLERLQRSRRGPLLLERIRQGALPGHYLRVYAWGEVRPRANGNGYEVKLDALDNLVIKAIAKSTNQG